MKSGRPLNVVFYQTGTGHEPVREWLKSLPKEERKTVGADILIRPIRVAGGQAARGSFGRGHLGNPLPAAEPHSADIICSSG